MKKVITKLLSVFVVMTLVFTALPTVSAKAGNKTDVFTEREHAELTYKEIAASYEHIDPTDFYAELEELADIAKEEANKEEAKKLFDKIEDTIEKMQLMGYIASNAVQINVADTKMAEEYTYTSSIMVQMADKMYTTLRDVIQLPGGNLIKESLKDSTVEGLLGYEEMTDEELAMYEKENELLLKYRTMQVEADTFTVDIAGIPMGYNEMNMALTMGMIGTQTYIDGFIALSQKKNTYLGEIYLELVELRKEVAAMDHYDYYTDYMYESYGRDYTKTSIQEFADAVKEHIVVPYAYMSMVTDYTAECLNEYYDPTTVLVLMRKFLPEISTELGEAFDYMWKYELYDLEYSETKSAGAYTSPLNYHGAAFIYMQPGGGAYDFGTLIHEFGHFNEFYWKDMGWEESLNLDIAEVHSQGLEVLFFDFYDEIFGDDAITMQEYSIGNLLAAYIQGCMINELEMYVFGTDDVTLEQINAKMGELAVAYGMVGADSPVLPYYAMMWTDIPHVYESPFYYISYATSVAGAFGIWEMANEDYNAAVEAYLEFASAGFDHEFVETLEKAGIPNVFDPENVAAVGKALMEEFDLEARVMAMYAPVEPQPVEPQLPTCHVRLGDTLTKIGKRFEVDWKEIAELNNLENPHMIYAGEELLLPADAVIKTETVTVEAGDTLCKIAERLGLNWKILAENIGLEAPYTIYAGDTIEFTY